MEPTANYHLPVMLPEVIQGLAVHSYGIYVDMTFGGGGHAAAVLGMLGGDGMLFGFDADPGAIVNAQKHFASESRLLLRQAYFTEACEMLRIEKIGIDGVLLDLGVSSRQLDSDQIGLSYRQEMPLDMRFRRDTERPSARDLVNSSSAGDLATLFRRYGEEPAAWKIAQAIASARSAAEIATTTDLREIIEAVIPQPFRTKTLARVFQALRIAVNDELGELESALDSLVGLLNPGGRIAVLTYHSLEDRIVKATFRREDRPCICPPGLPVCACGKTPRLRHILRKPLSPLPDEIEANPRARSARLRVAERLANTQSLS